MIFSAAMSGQYRYDTIIDSKFEATLASRLGIWSQKLCVLDNFTPKKRRNMVKINQHLKLTFAMFYHLGRCSTLNIGKQDK